MVSAGMPVMPSAQSGRVALDPLLQQLERRLHRGAVFQRVAAHQARVGALGVGQHLVPLVAVPPELVLRVGTALGDLGGLVAIEHAVVVALRVVDDQLGRVGVLDQELAVEQAQLQDLVDQGQEQGAVGAGLDRHPFIGDGGVAAAHGVDRDEAPAAALELGDLDLERIGVVVLGGADHDEQLGALQVRPAELPERAADAVDHAGGHVHRAETAMGGVVGRAELLGEHAGQGLHLIAAGEQRELLRVLGAQLLEPLGEHRHGLVPGDLLELGLAALGVGLAPQRLGEARRRHLLHDAGAALGADHALVQRVVRVALDVADLTVAQVHANAAAAGAHVTGGFFDFGATGVAVAVDGRVLHRGVPRGH